VLAVGRAYARATSPDEAELHRFGVTTEAEDNGRVGILAFVEYDDGNLGIYLASHDGPGHDQWIVISKGNLQYLQEATQRSMGR
jgi:hypothetical protein